MLKTLLLLSFIRTASTAHAHALERCNDDPLKDHLLEGRLNWLVKCGHVEQSELDYLLKYRLYWSFTRIAPNDAAADCFDLGTRRAPCVAVGCYAPGERLLFDGNYVAIDEAYALGLSTISTLGSPDITRPLHLKNTPIGSFVSGDAKEELILIETEGGSRLRVTKSHPLFDDTGSMVIANLLEPGKTRILTLRGPELVTSAEREMYEGKVWNVMPVSDAYSDNVVVAEDILTGSVRFQNQWADLKERFLLRNGEPLHDLERESTEGAE